MFSECNKDYYTEVAFVLEYSAVSVKIRTPLCISLYLHLCLSLIDLHIFSQETLRRLEEEHKKAEAEAHAAEGEAAEAKASWSEARRHHETLQKKHRAMEARIRHLQSELAQQQALSAEHRQGMATACLLLADEEEIKAAVKEADSQTAGLDSVARMHMGYYDMVQQKCLATSSLSQQVLKARARVMSLKTHLKSFKHSPCMVEPLMLQIQHLKEAVQSLRQQVC